MWDSTEDVFLRQGGFVNDSSGHVCDKLSVSINPNVAFIFKYKLTNLIVMKYIVQMKKTNMEKQQQSLSFLLFVWPFLIIF